MLLAKGLLTKEMWTINAHLEDLEPLKLLAACPQIFGHLQWSQVVLSQSLALLYTTPTSLVSTQHSTEKGSPACGPVY